MNPARAALVAALTWGAFSSAALAQTQKVVPELHGELSAATYEKFVDFVSRNLNKVVGLQISVEKSSSQAPMQASAEGGQFAVYMSSTPNRPSDSEVVAKSGYAYQHGSYVFDAFFIVKSGGMHQGVISYGLVQTDEAAIRLNRAISVRRITLTR